MNKKKIFNDPVYGLVSFEHEIIYKIIDHPYFQRLRRISQQALSHYVYPGALHTRFQHALGALHLMTKALDTLRSKGTDISDAEYEASCIAILLHDVGHGPFSHALEHTLIDIHHEEISVLLMTKIGVELNYDFTTALEIFKGKYHRNFLHQLVSGHIDVDRIDYLTRDSFFSGVAEGIIGYDRIIKMMDVVNDELVIEEKGIYSVEKFLMARRLMYWQVYLHKTVIAAEVMLISILNRAKFLTNQGVDIHSSQELNFFLNLKKGESDYKHQPDFLANYVRLDDMDVLWLIKRSVDHQDRIFRILCRNLLERKLLKVKIKTDDAYEMYKIAKADFQLKEGLDDDEISYFYSEKTEVVHPYDTSSGEINILLKAGKVQPYSALNPHLNIVPEERTFLFYLKENG
ncbi:MAG: HD domain-containing protein [Saprospiraceae bacterium]|nr:HD domain-containing protein [Saprospiraceae bacterium]